MSNETTTELPFPKVLLIEPEVKEREEAHRTLKSMGTKFVAVSNSEAALQVIDSHTTPFDFVLVDIASGNSGGNMILTDEQIPWLMVQCLTIFQKLIEKEVKAVCLMWANEKHEDTLICLGGIDHAHPLHPMIHPKIKENVDECQIPLRHFKNWPVIIREVNEWLHKV